MGDPIPLLLPDRADHDQRHGQARAPRRSPPAVPVPEQRCDERQRQRKPGRRRTMPLGQPTQRHRGKLPERPQRHVCERAEPRGRDKPRQERTEQGKGQEQGDHRDDKQVRERRAPRQAAKSQHGHGRGQHERPKTTAPELQPLPLPSTRVRRHRHLRGKQEAQHTCDRQGETGVQRRCRRKRDEDDRGERQRLQHLNLAAQRARHEQDARHPRGTQRRRGTPRHQRVAPDQQQPGGQQPLVPGAAAKQPRRQPHKQAPHQPVAEQKHDREVAAGNRNRVRRPGGAQPIVKLRIVVARVAERQRRENPAIMARHVCPQRGHQLPPPRPDNALRRPPRRLPLPVVVRFDGKLRRVCDVQRTLPAAPLPHAAQIQRPGIPVVRRRTHKRRHAHAIAGMHVHVALAPARRAHIHPHDSAARDAREMALVRQATRQPLPQKALTVRRPFGLGNDRQPLNRRHVVRQREVKRLRIGHGPCAPQCTGQHDREEGQRGTRQRRPAPGQQ